MRLPATTITITRYMRIFFIGILYMEIQLTINIS